ncbi:unnamed protein product [[Actinomadura] parvosata subsp. kistnae]|nr:unnamed protein product [Actinomadura parvosata subsp. kistnae]
MDVMTDRLLSRQPFPVRRGCGHGVASIAVLLALGRAGRMSPYSHP